MQLIDLIYQDFQLFNLFWQYKAINQADYSALVGRYLLHTAAGLTSPASSTGPQAAYQRFGGFVFSQYPNPPACSRSSKQTPSSTFRAEIVPPILAM